MVMTLSKLKVIDLCVCLTFMRTCLKCCLINRKSNHRERQLSISELVMLVKLPVSSIAMNVDSSAHSIIDNSPPF